MVSNQMKNNQSDISKGAKVVKNRGKAQTKSARGDKKLKSQQNYLSKPNFVLLLTTIALYPFATTEELAALSRVAQQLPLNRIQIYLRKAVEWGWVEYLSHNITNPNQPELSPLATATTHTLHRKLLNAPDLAQEQILLDALAQRAALRTGQGVKKLRHFYLTPAGAKGLVSLVQLREGELHRKNLQVWHANFTQCFGFTAKEILPHAQRLEALILTRRFLLALSGYRELWWNDNTFKYGPKTNQHNNLVDITNLLSGNNYLDALVILKNIPYKTCQSQDSSAGVCDTCCPLRGQNEKICSAQHQVFLVIADTEQLTPNWIVEYLQKLLPLSRSLISLASESDNNLYNYDFILHRSETTAEQALDILAQVSDFYNFDVAQDKADFTAGISAYNYDRALETPSTLAEHLRSVAGLPGKSELPINSQISINNFTRPNPDTETSFDGSLSIKATRFSNYRVQLKLVVLTYTKSRAALWEYLLSKLIQNLFVPNISIATFTADELMDTATPNKVQARLKVEMKPSSLSCDLSSCHPSSLSRLSLTETAKEIAFYLKEGQSDRVNQAEPGSINHLSQNALSRESIKKGVVATSAEEIFRDLLSQPTRRKLLFILHSFGSMDLLGCTRLSGVEITHLAPQLKCLMAQGLVARLWSGEVQKFRSKENQSRLNNWPLPSAPIINVVDLANNIAQSTTTSSFVTTNSTKFGRQDYGQLAKLIRVGNADNTSGKTYYKFPYESEFTQSQRYRYYLTEAGLAALEWLQGFALHFDPRYRREIGRFTRLHEEVVTQKRIIVELTGRSDVERAPQFQLTRPEVNVKFEVNSVSSSPQDVGFSWPSLITEHSSAINNFFLWLPSRHYFQPFSTASRIYTGNRKQKVSSWTQLGFATFETEQKLIKPEDNSYELSLESWQPEPYCHRFFLLPKDLALTASSQNPFIPTPHPELLVAHSGGTTGQCLPDGYGELSLTKLDGTKKWLFFYLEYERGRRNWLPRYLGKIASYICMMWSDWLTASIAAGELVSSVSKKHHLLLVAANADLERRLSEIFAISSLGILSWLWWEACYKGYGPGQVLRPVTFSELAACLAQRLVHILLNAKFLLDKTINTVLLPKQVPSEFVENQLEKLGAAINYLENNDLFQKLLEAGLEKLVYTEFKNTMEHFAYSNQNRLRFPRMQLAIYSTSNDLLVMNNSSSQIWKQVYTPWSERDQFKDISRLSLKELFV